MSAPARILCLLSCLLAVFSAVVSGQPRDSHSGDNERSNVETSAQLEKSESERKPVLEDVGPQAFYVEDANGNLVPVLMTLDELRRLLALDAQRPDRQPLRQYQLNRVAISGRAVAASHAEVQIEIDLMIANGDAVRVPLGLDEARLQAPESHGGPGTVQIEFDEGGDGWVAWFRGGGGSRHRLELQAVVALASVGDETRLKLSVPQAPVTRVQLSVPLAGATGRLFGGGILESTRPVGEGSTEFVAVGVADDLELAWQDAGGAVAERPAVLESKGQLLTRIDGRTVTTEAELEVRSYGGPFESFQVRLPPGADLLSGPRPGYRVAPVAETDVERPEPDANARVNQPGRLDRTPAVRPRGQLVDVRLDEPTSGPVTVQLLTEQTHGGESADRFVDLGGFEVVDSVRQWGHVAVQVEGDWQVVWGGRQGVRQADDLPVGLDREGLLAGFEYLTQPWSLEARVVPLESRIGVDPRYVFTVTAGRLELQAHLQYTIRGAKVFAFDVEFPVEASDWIIDEIGPANVVDHGGIAFGELKPLSIPLLQAATGEVTIELRAHRQLPTESGSFSLALPQPKVNTLGPASVVIAAADNVALTPRSDAIVGLSRQQSVPSVDLPRFQQEPFAYRGDVTDARFVASYEVRAQEISCDLSTVVRLANDAAAIEQSFAYQVAYEPVDQLVLDVPAALADVGRLQIRVDGEPVTRPIAVEPATGPGGGARLTVPLPGDRIGGCSLSARFRLPAAGWPTAGGLVVVPLAMPAQTRLSSNTALVVSDSTLHVAPVHGAWEVAAGVPTGRDVRLVARQPEQALPLDVRVESDVSTIVERAWIQSWLSNRARQDRAVFNINTTSDAARIRLPEGALLADAEVLLDGNVVSAEPTPDGKLVVPLRGDGSRRAHTVELRYHFGQEWRRTGRLRLKRASLVDDAFVHRLYWQVVLPRNVHVMVAPTESVGEYRWGWQGYYWGREPTLEQLDLESWSGAAHRQDVPMRTNRYVFSSQGPMVELELRTAARTWIVLVASGVTLIAGLALVYLPVVRQPAIVLALVLVVVSLGALWPEPTLLLSQAASVGLGLAIVAALLEQRMNRRRSWLPTGRGDSSAVRPDSTQTRISRAAGSRESTETTPIEIEYSASDSES